MKLLVSQLICIKKNLRSLYKKRRKVIRAITKNQKDLECLNQRTSNKKCFVIYKSQKIYLLSIEIEKNREKSILLSEKINKLSLDRTLIIDKIREYKELKAFENYRRRTYGAICIENILSRYEYIEKAAGAAFLLFKFGI